MHAKGCLPIAIRPYFVVECSRGAINQAALVGVHKVVPACHHFSEVAKRVIIVLASIYIVDVDTSRIDGVLSARLAFPP
eukprot:8402253-Prorocentrum_lima.AAC.1